MLNVVPFPATGLARGAAFAPDPTWSIFDVARQLGLYRHADRLERRTLRTPGFIVAHVNALIADAGFPLPYPQSVGGTVVVGATRNSRWPAAAVAAWFDDLLPPDARGIADAAERARVDSTLSSRAASMFAGAAA